MDQTNGYPANERERILQVELEAANFLREFVGIILCAKDPWHTYLSNGLSQRKPFKQEMQDMLTREHPRSGWAFDFFDQEFPGWCSVAASSTDARDYRDQIFEKFQNHVHRLVIYLMIRHKEKS